MESALRPVRELQRPARRVYRALLRDRGTGTSLPDVVTRSCGVGVANSPVAFGNSYQLDHGGSVNSVEAPPKKRIPYPAVIAVVAACLLVLRGGPRLRDAAFFAEDGQIFLSQAHNDCFKAVVEPYAGYLHLVPRIIAALLEPFPVTAAPVLYALAALLVHVAML